MFFRVSRTLQHFVIGLHHLIPFFCPCPNDTIAILPTTAAVAHKPPHNSQADRLHCTATEELYKYVTLGALAHSPLVATRQPMRPKAMG